MATAAEAAKHICLGIARFRDLVAMGVIPHALSGKYDLDAVREAYIPSLQRKASGREEEGGGSLSMQRARLAEAVGSRKPHLIISNSSCCSGPVALWRSEAISLTAASN